MSDSNSITVTDIYIRRPDDSITQIRICGRTVLSIEENVGVWMGSYSLGDDLTPTANPAAWAVQESIVDSKELALLYPHVNVTA